MASKQVAGAKRTLAPPSPSPSNASNASYAGTPSKKQKREERTRDNATPTPTPAAMAASNVSYGADDRTQKLYAVEFLKSKAVPKTLQEILDHLTLQHTQESYHKDFAKGLREHGQVTYLPDPAAKVKELKEKGIPAWRTGRYEFRAKIPGVKNKTTLLDYLQRKTDASKLEVKDLKDGWPDCDKAIDELEAAHKILVVRTRKDNRATHVWLDQPSLFHPVDTEFRAMWKKVKLPDVDDMVRRLTAIGQKPASEDPNLNKVTTTEKKQKRRVNRTSKKQTNEHMKHILQDYSHMVRR
ncbi:putative Transcription initiation factor IIE subunit beta [Seiridium cardinale]